MWSCCEGGGKSRRKRRSDVAQWSEEAVRLLIAAMRLVRWSSDSTNPLEQEEEQEEEQGLQKKNKTKQVWKLVARALHNKGHEFDAVQCKTKFKSLKTDYHAALQLHHPAATFTFFDDMRRYFVATPQLHHHDHHDLLLLAQPGQSTAEEFLASLVRDEEEQQQHATTATNKGWSKRPRNVSTSTCRRAEEEEAEDKYRSRKVELMERRVQLAEERVRLEMVRAENEQQRLRNEAQRIEVEETRLRQHEEQLAATTSILNSLLLLLSHQLHS